MAVRVLLVVAFSILYGCGKASPPPEEAQKVVYSVKWSGS